MIGKTKAGLLLAMCAALAAGTGAQAAVAESDVTQAYDAAVQLQDTLDGLDVTVKNVVSIAGQKASVQKTIQIQTSGMQSDGDMEAAIEITTSDGDKNQYYADGYFYSDQSGSKMKYAMDQEIMKELLNYYVYLDFDSEYLSMLEQQENSDGTVTYTFAATDETIGSYEDKMLEGAQEEHQVDLISVQGTVDADADGRITERRLEIVYSVKSGDDPQMCIVSSDAVFNSTENTTVDLPDLSSWSEKEEAAAVISITENNQTVYATTDVNVRAQNNVTSAVLGGIAAGDSLEETGYTNDGWIQIDYNGTTAYVSGDYISTSRPVIVTAMSGEMYATCQVNVRDAYSTDGAVLGVLSANEAVTVTGYTSNDWIQVSYNGSTGYVYDSYLTWDAPAAQTASSGGSGYLEGTVTDASMNSVTLVTSNGYTYTFYTGDAQKETVDGILNNDWIGVEYVTDGSSYTATVLYDYNNHDYSSYTDDNSGNTMNDNNGDDGYQDMESYGTVIAYGMSAVTVALDNGVTLSADKDDVTISGSLYEGAYVLVDYIGDYMYRITDVS